MMSLVKSPMGMMVGFMGIAVFLLPKLMDNIGKTIIIMPKHIEKIE